MSRAPVLLIEILDSAPGLREQGPVFRELGRAGIAEIGQQPEQQVRVLVAEKPDFERVEQLLRRCLPC